jgi:hypothetical protein
MGRALLVLETPFDRQKAVSWIGKAPVGTRVEFKASKRSLPQNDMLWALLTEFSEQFTHAGKKYEPVQWKAIFLHAFGREISFLPSLDNKTFLPIELSSSDLSKQEMTDFIEFIIKEGAERGVIFKDPKQPDSGEPLLSPDTADGSPSSAPADSVSPGAVSQPNQDETKGILIAFTSAVVDVLKTDLGLNMKHSRINELERDWKTMLDETEYEQLGKIKDLAMIVADGSRPLHKFINFMASDILDCLAAEIGG